MSNNGSQTARVGVIGDVHLFWDDADREFFNEAGYDLLLFVGDLAAYSQRGGRRVASSVAQLTTPTLVIPGNHDGLNAFQLGSEVFPRAHRWRHAFCAGQAERCRAMDDALGAARFVGFSRHRLEVGTTEVNIIAGRPHSIGGRRVACERYLRETFGVGSIEDSAALLRTLIDGCDDAPLLFLAHNGPSGLGDTADSIWGCDFRRKEEDWGDRDLELAIAHAKDQGRRVLAVAAGHMHRRTKSGKRRPPQVVNDGVLYINAAEVPRHRSENGIAKRHHVRLTIDGNQVAAEDVWVG